MIRHRLLACISVLSLLNLSAKDQELVPHDQPSHENLSEKSVDTFIKLDHKKTEGSPSQPITSPIHMQLNNVDYAQYPVAPQNTDSSRGNSGYHAFKNALLSLKMLQEDDKEIVEAELKNPALAERFFSTEKSLWRNRTIEFRKDELATQYLRDHLVLAIKGARKVGYQDITSFDFTPLYLEEAVVMFDKDKESAPDEVPTLINLIPTVAKQLLAEAQPTGKKAKAHKRSYAFTRKKILSAFTTELKKMAEQKNTTSLLEKRDILELYFDGLKGITYSISSTKNQNTVRVDGSIIYTRTHEGATKEHESLDGDWLSEFELKELIQKEKSDKTSLFQENLVGSTHSECLEYPLKNTAERVINTRKIRSLLSELEKKGTAIVFITLDTHWISCVLTKQDKMTSMVITDSINQDRRIEPAIMNLIKLLDNKEEKKSNKESSKNDLLTSLLKPDKKKEDGPEPINYDAPLSGYGLDDLPSLEDFFGGKIPNNIEMRVRQIKELTKDPHASGKKAKIGTIIKNCTLFYGPPGTGKSTIAYIMALLAAKEAEHDIDIVYAGGGDFRDAFQGSGKAKLDALFAEAKNRKNPCVVIIDEIDGATSKLEPRSSTQEDNRALKSLITTLDKHRYDPGLYVICTTNYPEKIDPAILRRFSSIEMPLPDYQMRTRVLEYYLRINDIEVKAGDPKAVSPAFLESFITTTDGMSGDALSDIVNNAVHESGLNLKPEQKIGLGFRFKSIDLLNRSLTSNVMPLLAAPLMPVAHFFNRYKHTDLEMHLYAQFMRHQKLKADIDDQQRKKALEDYHAKQLPLFTRWGKIAENATISHVAAGTTGVFIAAGIIWAAKKMYDKTYHATNENITIPWLSTPAPQPQTAGTPVN